MVDIGEVPTWDTGLDTRSQAVKAAEEVMEVFSAVEDLVRGGSKAKVLEECADVVQAVCNLVDMLGGGPYFKEHMRRCRMRNEERGRL